MDLLYSPRPDQQQSYLKCIFMNEALLFIVFINPRTGNDVYALLRHMRAIITKYPLKPGGMFYITMWYISHNHRGEKAAAFSCYVSPKPTEYKFNWTRRVLYIRAGF